VAMSEKIKCTFLSGPGGRPKVIFLYECHEIQFKVGQYEPVTYCLDCDYASKAIQDYSRLMALVCVVVDEANNMRNPDSCGAKVHFASIIKSMRSYLEFKKISSVEIIASLVKDGLSSSKETQSNELMVSMIEFILESEKAISDDDFNETEFKKFNEMLKNIGQIGSKLFISHQNRRLAAFSEEIEKNKQLILQNQKGKNEHKHS
jgi:hypothetical protein